MTWIDVATIVAVPVGLGLMFAITFLGIAWAIKLMGR